MISATDAQITSAPTTKNADFLHTLLQAKDYERTNRNVLGALVGSAPKRVKKLGKDEIVTILDLELAKLRTRLSEKNMTLELDKKAVDFLVSKGSDEAMGARPLRRAVQHWVEDPLADLLLRDSLTPGRIKVSLEKDETALTFKQRKN